MATSAKRKNDLSATLLNSTVNSLLKEYQFSSNSGLRLVAQGQRVRVADDFADANAAGKVFQFMGTDREIDLSTADYADFELWKELTDTNVLPSSVVSAALKELKLPTGGSKSYYAVVVRNDVRAHADAYLSGIDLTAGGDVTVEALEAASITSYDDSVVSAQSEARGGVIATNQVQATADALVRSSSVTTDRGGRRRPARPCRRHRPRSSPTALTKASSSDTVGVIIALNTVGWAADNILFTLIDALLGSSYLTTERPVSATRPRGRLDHRRRGRRIRRRRVLGRDHGGARERPGRARGQRVRDPREVQRKEQRDRCRAREQQGVEPSLGVDRHDVRHPHRHGRRRGDRVGDGQRRDRRPQQDLRVGDRARTT